MCIICQNISTVFHTLTHSFASTFLGVTYYYYIPPQRYRIRIWDLLSIHNSSQMASVHSYKKIQKYSVKYNTQAYIMIKSAYQNKNDLSSIHPQYFQIKKQNFFIMVGMKLVLSSYIVIRQVHDKNQGLQVKI